MLEEKLQVTFIEVKMNEYQIPWEENPEDQNDSLFPEAKLQLKKDVIRFLELFPDVKLSGKLDIRCFAAFPNLQTDEKITKERSLILIKPDTENPEILSDKLHLYASEKGTEEMNKLLEFMFGRFIGPMSTIPNKSFADFIPETKKALNLSIAATDTALQSQIENIDPLEDSLDTSLKEKLLEDKTTKDILDALSNKSYQRKFEEQYPGIKLIDLANAKKQSKYPLQTTKGKIPIFGTNGIKKVLDHFDDSLQHQGLKTLMEKLLKEKIILHAKNSGGTFAKVEEKNLQDFLESIRNCGQCQTVEELKSCGTANGRLTEFQTEEEIIKALKFADKFHTGINIYSTCIVYCLHSVKRST